MIGHVVLMRQANEEVKRMYKLRLDDDTEMTFDTYDDVTYAQSVFGGIIIDDVMEQAIKEKETKNGKQ